MITAGEFFKVDSTTSDKLLAFVREHEFIYRYLPMEYLLDTLQKKHMVFVNPNKWNDPFDNYLFKLAEKEFQESFTSSLFCQCITLNPHSQAYWKTYGGNGFAARLKIKTKEYLDVIKATQPQFWIGKMEYINEKELIERLKNTPNLRMDLSSKTVTDNFLEAFFLKRKPFEYEDEIRLLIQSSSTKEKLKMISNNNTETLKEVRLDPRMGKNEAKAWKEYLKQFGIKVTKSQLFTDKKIL